MTYIESIFETVLRSITPIEEDIEITDFIVQHLRSLLINRSHELDIKITDINPQGSTGIKQTQLRDDYDIDLFIGLDFSYYQNFFNFNTKKGDLKSLLRDFFHDLCLDFIIKTIEKSKHILDCQLTYADHPYVISKYIINDKIINLDIVLYFDLPFDYLQEYGPISAVDRTPWHGRFIERELSFEQRNNVRLLKQFFKVNYCYGDKSALGKSGFTGYSAELLIYYFGDLYSVLENFRSLVQISLDYYGRNKNELSDIHHFSNDYLIIIDPTDKNRNVASSISERAYKYCLHKVMQFLNDPKDFYFFKGNIPLFSHGSSESLFVVELESINDYTHYTICRDKLYSLGEQIKQSAKLEHGNVKRFGMVEFEIYFNKDLFTMAFYCEDSEISNHYIRHGPSIFNHKNSQRFMEANPCYFEQNDQLWISQKRQFTSFLEFLISFCSKIDSNLFDIINISRGKNVQTEIGSKCLYILQNMVLPFV